MTKGVRPVVLKMVSLVLISTGLAFVANRFGPRRIAWVQDWAHHVEQLARADGISVIPLFEAVQAFDEQSALFVDARSAERFAAGHISGALSVPVDHLEAQLFLLDEARPLIIYCDGPACDDALNLCRELKGNGLVNLRLFADGFEMWQRLGRPVATEAER